MGDGWELCLRAQCAAKGQFTGWQLPADDARPKASVSLEYVSISIKPGKSDQMLSCHQFPDRSPWRWPGLSSANVAVRAAVAAATARGFIEFFIDNYSALDPR